jgi:hypothetical protein
MDRSPTPQNPPPLDMPSPPPPELPSPPPPDLELNQILAVSLFCNCTSPNVDLQFQVSIVVGEWAEHVGRSLTNSA